MKDEHIVRLKVRSVSRTAEQITNAVGLRPDKSWRVGDLRAGTEIKEECNGWILDSGLSKTEEVAAHLDRIISRIGARTSDIKTLAEVEDVEVSIVLYVTSAQAGLNLSKRHVEFVSALGGTLDVDLYFLGEDDL